MQYPELRYILVVEDDPDIRALLQRALERLGGSIVTCCGSGVEALRSAPLCCPDLILLDIHMPEMDEPTTLIALRHIPGCHSTLVVWTMVKPEPTLIARLADQHALEVITKPFDIVSLPTTLRRMWKRSAA